MPMLAREKGVSRTAIRAAIRGTTFKNSTLIAPVEERIGIRNILRKVTPGQVHRLRAEFARGGQLNRMAKREGVSYSTMYKIVHGETFKWVT
jgi:hypothetical protein